MSGAQRLSSPHGSIDLSTTESGYFGRSLAEFHNAGLFGLEPSPSTEMYRVSYVYQMVFSTNPEQNPAGAEYGGIQLRARTHLHLENGAVPTKLQRHIQRAAHRGAYIFDSSLQKPVYAGYLSGFKAGEADDYQNWEVEPISGTEASGVMPGKIDWFTEIYLDAESTPWAELSGLAAGVADPYDVTIHVEEGSDATHIPPFAWEIDYYPESRPDYYEIRPPGYEAARERYREGAGAGKTVYINGEKIGELDNAGRVWLNKEYGRGDGKTWGDSYSRYGLVEDTAATYQALRNGGTLYMTGETENAVYLATARAKPDGWTGIDPDEVPTDLTVREGRESREIILLSVDDPDDPIPVECRADKEVIKHLGYSDPTYTHGIAEMWGWPGFRPVEEYGTITTDADRRDDRDDGQTGLDSFEP
jgi:hypothetical protein